MKTRSTLMKYVHTPLAKSVLVPLGLTAAASGTDAAIQNKIFGSGMTTLIVSNEEIEHIMKIVKSLKKSGLLIKGVSKLIKNEPLVIRYISCFFIRKYLQRQRSYSSR